MHKRTLLVLVGLALAVIAAISTSSADVSHDPASPVAIPYDQGYDFALWGSRAGSFAYYKLEYPGNGSVITIRLDMAPGDPAAQRGLGFNVYAIDGYLIGSGTRAEDVADQKVLQWADFNRGPWLIQVYNYLDGLLANFHLQVQGLPGLAPTPHPVMMPAQAATFSASSDTLIGDHAGNFRFYKVESTGDGREVTLQLYYIPDNQWISNGFGLKVYAPRDGIVVAEAGHETTFRLEWPGTYLIQVYNYIDDTKVIYWLNRFPSE
jgi:hypothetical protein